MTSPVALIGLTYRGTDVQAFPPGVFLELDPAAIYGRLEVDGADQPLLSGGVFPRNRVARRRLLPVSGLVSCDPSLTSLADQRESLVDNLQIVEALFDVTEHGDLVATLADATTRTIDARPQGSVLVTMESDLVAVVSVTLQSYSTPDWTIGP